MNFKKEYTEKYVLDGALLPILKSKIVYNETAMFVGENDAAPLLFNAEKIICVKNYALDKTFIEGKDYVFKNNKIVRLTDSEIPFFTKEEFYPETPIPGNAFPCSIPNTPYLFFGEGGTFTDRQIAITYERKEITLFPKLNDYSDRFPKTLIKLKNKQTITALFYGDSITVGANASAFIGVKPFAESWPMMVSSFLRKKYGTEVNYVNTAVGGAATDWGVENAFELAAKYKPDVLFLSFGMNDLNLTNEEFAEKMNAIIKTVKDYSPETEIMLISSILPNVDVAGYGEAQYRYESVVKDIAEKRGFGVSTISSLHKYALNFKRYYDTTGNNVNHPNDFLSRAYSQTILYALLGNDYLNYFE